MPPGLFEADRPKDEDADVLHQQLRSIQGRHRRNDVFHLLRGDQGYRGEHVGSERDRKKIEEESSVRGTSGYPV